MIPTFLEATIRERTTGLFYDTESSLKDATVAEILKINKSFGRLPRNIESWTLNGSHPARSEIPGHLFTMSKESTWLCTKQCTGTGV